MTDFSKLTLDGFLAALSPTRDAGRRHRGRDGGAMGASLAEMVSALTLSKEKYAASHDAMRPILEAAQLARSEF
jgi:hypothetical protein